MGKMVLSLDGGGIRGAAATRFLSFVESALLAQQPPRKLRECVDLFAGTSTGSIIALGLAASGLTMRAIDDMYNAVNAQAIFTENRGWFEIDGVNAPRYEGKDKTRVLKTKLGKSRIGDVGEGKHVLVVTYSVETRLPLIIKSTKSEHKSLLAYQVADASSAAPTYFPTVKMAIPDGSDLDHWLIDGGVIANNPTMCAISEVRRTWPEVSMDDIRVLSVGTGSLTRKINGPKSRKWGSVGWFVQGQILDVLADERVVAYQAKNILADGNYIRVNADLRKQPGLDNPPDDAMDDVSPANILKLRALGDLLFDLYGKQAVELILGNYQGTSMDRISPETGMPI